MLRKLCVAALVLASVVSSQAGETGAKAILQNENNCRPPTIITLPCPGGGYEWSVQEDRNCDGVYDWVTVKRSDGSLCSQPIQSVANPIGNIVDEVFSIAFTSWQCADGRWQWQLDLFDRDSSLLASVIQRCGDTTPHVVYSAPPVIAQSSNEAETSQARIFPNPTTGELLITNAEAVVKIDVYDKNGRRIEPLTLEARKDGETYVLRLSDSLPSGVYLLAIHRAGQKPEFVPFVMYH